MKTIPKEKKKLNSKKLKYKSLVTVLAETYDRYVNIHSPEAYFIDFSQVHTLDLITMMRRLTFLDHWTYDIKVKEPDYDREEYFKTLASVVGAKFTELDAKSITNKTFLDNRENFVHDIKAVLATREHIPSGKQAKEIRRKKAQGKYIID